MHGLSSVRYYSIDFKPGVDLVVSPKMYANFKFKTTMTFGIPLSFGFQYNYSTNFSDFYSHGLEPLLGINKFIINANYLKFLRIHAGYNLVFYSTDADYEFFN